MKEKVLQQIHFVTGFPYFQKLSENDMGAMEELIAIYLADPSTLRKARTSPEVLDPLRIQASEMDGDEVVELLGFFTGAFNSFYAKLGSKFESVVVSQLKITSK